MATRKVYKNVNLLTAGLGQPTDVQLVATGEMVYLAIRAALNLTIAGGAANGTLQNRGSVLAMLDFFLVDGSERVSAIKGRCLKALAEYLAPRALSDFNRLASGAIQGPTTFYEHARMWFGLPLLAVPSEAFYITKNRQSERKVTLQIQPAAVPRDTVLSGSDRVWTHNSFVADVIQKVEDQEGTPPFFDVVLRQVGDDVLAGAVADRDIPLTTNKHRVLGLLVEESAADYEVADIIDDLAVVSDERTIVEKTPVGILRNEDQAEFGGGLPINGYYFFPFLESGRWGGAINPMRDHNVRVRYSASALSATAGTNRVRVWAVEATTIPGITAPPPA